MLDNLIYSLNAVVPVFLIIVLGYFLKRVSLIDDRFVSVSEKLVFKLSLPVMLFLEVSSAKLSDAPDARLILVAVVGITLSFVAVIVISAFFIKDKKSLGAFAQGVCRSNFAILGVPLADNMFSGNGVLTVALVMPFAILCFNVYSVIILSLFSGEGKARSKKEAALGILKNIATNPLIVGVLAGAVFMLCGIKLPQIPSKALGYVSNLTTPLALIALGANFKAESIRDKFSLSLIATLIKLIVLPTLAVAAAALIGLRGVSLGVVLILFGAPTAVSSYIMAKNMNSDHELAAEILLFTTVGCAFTVFAGTFILKSLCLI